MTGGQFIPGVKIFRDTGRAAIDRYILPARPTAANPQQRRAPAECWY